MGSFNSSSSSGRRRTSNPAMQLSVFKRAVSIPNGEIMTMDGAINKVGILLLLVIGSSFFTFTSTYNDGTGIGFSLIGAFIAFIVALVTTFSPQRAPITAPLYAIFEGLFLGGISAYFELRYPGIVFQSIGLTMGIFVAMLAIYKFRIVNVTKNFRMGVIAATGGVVLFYIASILLQLFGVYLPSLGNGIFGIGISLVVVVIAAMNLVLDFDFIEEGVEAEAPKYMEWYSAFGLMVTLVWLYVEVLRLFSRSRD
jgi:uncharacterized YccA/Bax inhibitor family protein